MMIGKWELTGINLPLGTVKTRIKNAIKELILNLDIRGSRYRPEYPDFI